MFGWIELSASGTDLIEVGDAVAYGAKGIVVGMANPFPDPVPVLSPGGVAAFGLLLVAGMYLTIRRRGSRVEA